MKIEDSVNVIYFGNEMIYSVYIFHWCYNTLNLYQLLYFMTRLGYG